MGIFSKLASKAVLDVAKRAAAVTTIEYLNKNHSVKGVLKNSEMNHKLIIKRKINLFGKKFYVLDENKNKKYKLEKEFNTIRLFDNNEYKIGKVTEHKDFFTKLKYYNIYSNGKKLGTAKQAYSLKRRLDLKFNNWRIEGNISPYHFNIFDDNDCNIMKIHRAYDRDDYVMEFNDASNEIIGILILMIIELMKN